MILFLERFARQLHGFGDGRSADRSPPLPNDFVPVHSLSHLLEHLGNPYAGSAKGWLTEGVARWFPQRAKSVHLCSRFLERR